MQKKYKLNRASGALQESYEESNADIPLPQQALHAQQNATGLFPLPSASMTSNLIEPPTHLRATMPAPAMRRRAAPVAAATRGLAQQALAPDARADHDDPDPHDDGRDPIIATPGASTSMWFTTVEDGQQVLVIARDGSMRVVKGPDRVWTWGCKVRGMDHYIAHPGEFLMVQYRDGRQEHLGGPVHVWFDPREHKSIHKEDALNIAANEAVVVYAEDLRDGQEVSRRIVHGPATFFPKPGEWLHTFSWHGSAPGADGYRKVPNALVFQKLWKMPDQMYHDVTDVRTADDALITIRLMLFFELLDIEQMLAATHDPIGDFINAATADIVEFLSRHDFESFKHHTEKLNDLSTYKQLAARADQCGYAINKVVYRGYGAPARLQAMHDEAIERRTRLRLDRDTQQQAQELEDLALERTLRRNHTQREDARADQDHQLALDRQRRRAEQEDDALRRDFLRAQQAADAAQRLELERASRQAHLDTLTQLGALGVDLTAYLTARPSDRIVELRAGPNAPTPHLHLSADPTPDPHKRGD